MGGAWGLYLWERGVAQQLIRVRYRCGSWRHDGACARFDASVAFARINEAMSNGQYTKDGWVFFVLTLDRNGFYGGEPWTDVQHAFKSLSQMSRNFMARLRRISKRNGWRNPASDWVAAVEQHRSGWPHMNLIVYAPELAAELERDRLALLSLGETDRESVLVRGELLDALTETRWGTESTAEKAKSPEALAGYIVKLAGEFAAASGELAKLTQAPKNAEGKFRRLRAGKGFLPPRRKNPKFTGTLIRPEWDPQKSAYGAIPLHNIKRAEDREIAAQCCALEADRLGRITMARGLAKTLGVGLREVGPPIVERYVRVGTGFRLLDSS